MSILGNYFAHFFHTAWSANPTDSNHKFHSLTHCIQQATKTKSNKAFCLQLTPIWSHKTEYETIKLLAICPQKDDYFLKCKRDTFTGQTSVSPE
jgi:hypothetical protein